MSSSPVTASQTGPAPYILIGGESHVLTFADEFNGATGSFWQGFGSGGTWATSFSPHLEDTRTITRNRELQIYVDPDMDMFPTPFTLGDGVMTLHAAPLSAEQRVMAGGPAFGSGMLSTEMTFSFSGGYLEIRADVPDQVGLWSAFWLLPVDGSWSAEIDVFEFLGEDAGTFHTNLWKKGTPDAAYLPRTGAGEGFHTYGLFWGDEVIQWYFDGQLVRETSAAITEEMYLIINLAVGGWAQAPDSSTDFSDGLSIDYIRVYEPEDDPTRNAAFHGEVFLGNDLHCGGAGNDLINGTRWGDRISAGMGDDTVYGDDGSDTLAGDAGQDRLFGHAGDDQLDGGEDKDHLVGGRGSDVLAGGPDLDHLWGGAYAPDGCSDRFVFAAGCGTDYVHDFEPGVDRIDLSALNPDALTAGDALRDEGWATRLDLSALAGMPGDAVYLVGISREQISWNDFIFVAAA